MKTTEIKESVEQMQHSWEMKTTEIKESVEATAELVRGTLEAKTDEIKGTVEATARDFMTKAEELDRKLKDKMKEAAEDFTRETQSLFRHRDVGRRCAAAEGEDSGLLAAFPRSLLNGFGGSEEPAARTPPRPLPNRQKSA